MSINSKIKNLNISLSETTIEKLDGFANILNEWNKTHNITGAKSIDIIEENIIDALLPINFMTFPSTVLDIGTGAGFPGLILAIVLPNTSFMLCEPLQKRTAFLRFAVMSLELKNVSIMQQRVEKIENLTYELITSRAVTNTKLILDLTRKIRDCNTQYLLYKGSRVFEEINNIDEHKLSYDIMEKNFRNYLHIKSVNVI